MARTIVIPQRRSRSLAASTQVIRRRVVPGVDVLLGLLGLVLFAIVVVAVVVGWRIGSWWAVPAATTGGFVGPALLVGAAEMDHARTTPVSSVDLARLIYPMGYAACITLGLVAGTVSALVVGLQRHDGTPPVTVAARLWLVGGSVAGLLLIGWWVVLVGWAADEFLNGQLARAPVPTARFLAVLLAVGLGAVGGGSGGLALQRAGAARGPARRVVEGGIYLGALSGLLLLAVVGLPAAPRPETSARFEEWVPTRTLALNQGSFDPRPPEVQEGTIQRAILRP